MSRILTFGRGLPPRASASALPDWQQADPRWIDNALAAALARPGGGWFAVDSSRRIGTGPARFRIDDRDIVLWRGAGGLMAAPDACPHMGASLGAGCVRNGQLVCPWHGLELGAEPHGSWRPLPAFDDGVLAWVRFDDVGEPATAEPIRAARPPQAIDAVVRLEARCEPEDVLANRLDPWHGVHYHPHSFKRLRVLERRDDEITVRVAFGVIGPFAVEVDARFHCPDPRTIVMTIVAGDGMGSVVETHATPIDAHHCAIIEATLAASDRPQMRWLQPLARFIRPWIERRAARLWIDDVAYAEQRRRNLERRRR